MVQLDKKREIYRINNTPPVPPKSKDDYDGDGQQPIPDPHILLVGTHENSEVLDDLERHIEFLIDHKRFGLFVYWNWLRKRMRKKEESPIKIIRIEGELEFMKHIDLLRGRLRNVLGLSFVLDENSANSWLNTLFYVLDKIDHLDDCSEDFLDPDSIRRLVTISILNFTPTDNVEFELDPNSTVEKYLEPIKEAQSNPFITQDIGGHAVNNSFNKVCSPKDLRSENFFDFKVRQYSLFFKRLIRRRLYEINF